MYDIIFKTLCEWSECYHTPIISDMANAITSVYFILASFHYTSKVPLCRDSTRVCSTTWRQTCITYTEPEMVFITGMDLHREVFWLGGRKLALLIQEIEDTNALRFHQLCSQRAIQSMCVCVCLTSLCICLRVCVSVCISIWVCIGVCIRVVSIKFNR